MSEPDDTSLQHGRYSTDGGSDPLAVLRSMQDVGIIAYLISVLYIGSLF